MVENGTAVRNRTRTTTDQGETRRVSSPEADLNSSINRLKRKVYVDLPAAEYYLYVIIWLSSIFYTIYLFYLESLKRRREMFQIRLFKPWWYSWTWDLYQDNSDYEWETWKKITGDCKILLPAVMYPLCSQIVKRISLNWNTYFTMLYSVMWTVYLVGVYPVLYLILQILVIFLAYLATNNAFVIWSVALIYSQAKLKLDDYVFPEIQDWAFSGYITMITGAWMNCRCVSFCLDRVWGHVPREESVIKSFVNLLAFCFYLPLGIMGPLITSKQFKEGMERKHKFDLELVKFIILQGLRYYFWFLVSEVMLCLVYNQALIHKPQFVESMSMWTLSGMCYLLGQFFQLKYVLMYGTGCYLSKLDNIDAPPHPKCIGRIHLYSDMWRHFDVGLYKFMHTYIYTPLANTTTSFIVRMVVTAVIYSFVYVWHGVQDFILIWSLLNYFGVLSESIAREVGKTQVYSRLESEYLGARGQRRFHALISSPLFLMSCLSNFYFFTGMQVGNIIVRRTFSDTLPYGLPYLLFVLYTGAQFSIQVKNWEIKRQIKALELKQKSR